MKLPLLTAAFVLLATPAFANGCANAQTQAQMTTCAGQDYKTADRALNVAYRALVAKITPAGRAKLLVAERAWIAYRDGECAFETMGSAGGSIHPMIVAMCLTALTRQQTARLEGQLRCQEGDVGCGGQ